MHIDVLRKLNNTSNYYYNIAYEKAVARDLSGAVEYLNKSLRYNKANIDSRNLLGLIYYETGEIVEAMSHWVISVNYQQQDNIAERYLKDIKKDTLLLDAIDQQAKKFNMAIGYAESEDYDLAILQLKNTLSASPHFVNGYLLLALLYIRQANYEKARKTLRRVLKIDRTNMTAIHYLHEMGDSEENIAKLSMESIENDGLLEDVYMEEAAATAEPAVQKKTVRMLVDDIVERQKQTVVKTGELGEVTVVKYSGMYVLLGIAIGMLLLFFVVVPAQKKNLKKENDSMVISYSEELSVKNSQISTLESEVDSLRAELDTLKKSAKNLNNPMPDYSGIKNGMSEEDISDMINKE